MSFPGLGRFQKPAFRRVLLFWVLNSPAVAEQDAANQAA
jgi:hypothetical protein